MSESSHRDAFMSWYGSTDERRKYAAHDDVNIRARALASLRQLGHGDMDHKEYTQLHHAHLMKTMTTGSLSDMYMAMHDPRLKTEHLEAAIARKYTTHQGRDFQNVASMKLQELRKQ